MRRWVPFLALLIIAGVSLWLGIRPEDGFSHLWLSLALVAIFVASEARYWKPSHRLR